MDISGFDAYNVSRIWISDRYSQHSKCLIDLTIENEKAEDFISSNKAGEKTVCASIEGEIVFSGTIRSIRLHRTYLKTNIQVEAVSFTDLIDSEIHSRVFQNPNKTYGQMNAFFAKNQVRIACVEDSIRDEKIEGFLVQDQETDFAFLNRIYRKKGLHLFLQNHKKSGCLLEIGKKKKTGRESIKSEEMIRFEQIVSQNREEIRMSTDRVFAVGSEIAVSGRLYVIQARTIESKYEKLEIEYCLSGSQQEDDVCEQENTVCLGLAKVTGNASEDHCGRIQAEFLNYENAMADEKIWMDYLSPLTEQEGGIVAVPDEGEIVEVLMRESACIAIGCVRKNELDERLWDITKRSALVRGCLLSISDKKAEVEIDSYKVSISDKILHASNEKFEILIKEGQCKIGFDDSQIVIEEDSIQLAGNKKLEMKTNQLELEGTNSVKVKTGSFDVG